MNHRLGCVRGVKVDIDALGRKTIERSVPLDVDRLRGVDIIPLVWKLVESPRTATCKDVKGYQSVDPACAQLN